MLAYDLEVNGVATANDLDGDKVTKAYRRAIADLLLKLMAEDWVAERKATREGEFTLNSRVSSLKLSLSPKHKVESFIPK